jgi:hypothetical protein
MQQILSCLRGNIFASLLINNRNLLVTGPIATSVGCHLRRVSAEFLLMKTVDGNAVTGVMLHRFYPPQSTFHCIHTSHYHHHHHYHSQGTIIVLKPQDSSCKIWGFRGGDYEEFLSLLMTEALSSYETSVLTRAARCYIPQDVILHSHRCETEM